MAREGQHTKTQRVGVSLFGLAAAVFSAAAFFWCTVVAFAANPQDAQDAGPIDIRGSVLDAEIGAIDNANDAHKDEDPFIDYTTVRDGGTTATSSSGIFSGSTASSRTSDTGAGGDGFYNASKLFNLGANQSLLVGALYRYDDLQTSYSTSSPTALGDGDVIHRITDTFGGLALYNFDNYYLAGALAGTWGSGSWTNTIGGITGHFNTDGYAAVGQFGRIFTLLGSPTASRSALPVKAAPMPAGGYLLQLDLSGHVGYAREEAGSFTDNTGFIHGPEQMHSGVLGGEARLFATFPNGRVTWRPYVMGTVDQDIGFSHTLTFPVQPAFAFPGDVTTIGSAQTMWGSEIGVAAKDVSGLVFGVRGFYRESSEYRIAGGQAFLGYRF